MWTFGLGINELFKLHSKFYFIWATHTPLNPTPNTTKENPLHFPVKMF